MWYRVRDIGQGVKVWNPWLGISGKGLGLEISGKGVGLGI